MNVFHNKIREIWDGSVVGKPLLLFDRVKWISFDKSFKKRNYQYFYFFDCLQVYSSFYLSELWIHKNSGEPGWGRNEQNGWNEAKFLLGSGLLRKTAMFRGLGSQLLHAASQFCRRGLRSSQSDQHLWILSPRSSIPDWRVWPRLAHAPDAREGGAVFLSCCRVVSSTEACLSFRHAVHKKWKF